MADTADGVGRRSAAGAVSPDLTEDQFLGGRLTCLQPAKGFRAGADTVLLAAAVPAQSGQHVIELGCGVGIASLCVWKRVPDVAVTGLELNAESVALARENATRNAAGRAFTTIEADVTTLPKSLPRHHSDHVFFNPPFLDEQRASVGAVEAKARAIAHARTGLDLWIKSGLALLKPKGTLTIIHRADALGRLLAGLTTGCGDIEVIPIHAYAGRDAIRVIIRAVKGRRGPLRIRPSVVLHQEGGAFTAQIDAVLRDGQPLVTSVP